MLGEWKRANGHAGLNDGSMQDKACTVPPQSERPRVADGTPNRKVWLGV